MANGRIVTPRKAGPPIPADWRPRYLELIEQHGNYYVTAQLAGVSYRTALRARVLAEFALWCSMS